MSKTIDPNSTNAIHAEVCGIECIAIITDYTRPERQTRDSPEVHEEVAFELYHTDGGLADELLEIMTPDEEAEITERCLNHIHDQ